MLSLCNWVFVAKEGNTVDAKIFTVQNLMKRNRLIVYSSVVCLVIIGRGVLLLSMVLKTSVNQLVYACVLSSTVLSYQDTEALRSITSFPLEED